MNEKYNKIIEKYVIKTIDWDRISKEEVLTEDFIREFADEVNWIYISIYQELSESFIREFKDRVKWDKISIHQKLTEPFIREFKDRVDWVNISAYQELSEPFIREFKDRVSLYHISNYQKISDDFAKELGIKNPVLAVAHNVGIYKNVIRVFKKEPSVFIINDKRFRSKDEAIKYVRKYCKEEKDVKEYIDAIDNFVK